MIFHLLIVDDEATMRKGLSSFINWESIDCIVSGTACDGADAIKKMQETPIDIIITDIKMPGIDGLELSKYVYENHPEIAIILLSGYAEFEYARTAIQYNVSHFLLKPTSKDEIVAVVKDVQEKIIISKRKNLIAKNELAFLKEQILQELTCSGLTSDIMERLKKYGILLDAYYVAAFRLANASTDIKQLKENIIQQKANSYCFRYNNLILSVYYSDELSHVIENCGEIINISDQIYSMNISVGISQFHQGAEEFSTAASEAIYTLSLNFYSVSPIAVFDGQNNQAEYILSAEDTLSLYDLETSILQRDFPAAFSTVNALFIKLKSNFVNESDSAEE